MVLHVDRIYIKHRYRSEIHSFHVVAWVQGVISSRPSRRDRTRTQPSPSHPTPQSGSVQSPCRPGETRAWSDPLPVERGRAQGKREPGGAGREIEGEAEGVAPGSGRGIPGVVAVA